MAVESTSELVSVVTLLGVSVIAVPLFKKLGLGSVIGYLAAGLVIGPFGFGFFNNPQAIIHIAELGVVMFLFVIGLEMKPSHLWSLRQQIFGLGFLQVTSCALLLSFVGFALGFSWTVSFVSAAGFVLTSTATVMQVLGERHELSSSRGQKVVSILLFEDLLIVPLLALVAFMSTSDSVMSVDNRPVWQRIGISALSLSALIAAGLWLLNPLFRILAKAKAREVMTAAALLVVLGAALLMDAGGLSMAMGAFVAGVLLSESSFRHQLEADIEPFRGLLLGLFFLAVGMSLNIDVVMTNWQLILLGLITMMTLKAGGIYIIARLTKSKHAEALDRAVLMAQGGEFAFVLFSAALSKEVIDSTVNANMTAIVVLSMAFTPLFVIIHNGMTHSKESVLQDDVESVDGQNLRGSVLIIGFGRVGQIASQLPIAYGADISIIDNDPDVIRRAQSYGFCVYYGDGSREEVLHSAGVEHANCILICINDPLAATSILKIARSINLNVKVVVRAFDREHAIELAKAEADFFVRETFEAAIMMGSETIKILGASTVEVEGITEIIRRADKERLVLETSGDDFAGQALLLRNLKN